MQKSPKHHRHGFVEYLHAAATITYSATACSCSTCAFRYRRYGCDGGLNIASCMYTHIIKCND